MGDSFPKSTRQSQMPGHPSAEGGRRVEWVVPQSGGPGVKYGSLPARLRDQGPFQSRNPFDFGKESPMALLISGVIFKKPKYYGRYNRI